MEDIETITEEQRQEFVALDGFLTEELPGSSQVGRIADRHKRGGV